MSTAIQRIDTWARRNSYVLRIPPGMLVDDGTGAVLADPQTITARAYVDDGLPEPTAIAGVGAVPFTYAAGQWVCELPYSSTFNARATIRVIATLTNAGTGHDLMDARVTLVRADGR